MELFPRGIFILPPAGAQQLHQTLIKVFKYAEGILLPAKEEQKKASPPVQVKKAASPIEVKREPSPVPQHKEEPLKPQEISDDSLSDVSSEPKVVDSTPAATFDESDFPTLGFKSKVAIENAKTTTQKEKALGDNKKKRWKRLDDAEQAITIGEDLSIIKSVYIYVNLGTIQRFDAKT
jgi:hypothetical protein